MAAAESALLWQRLITAKVHKDTHESVSLLLHVNFSSTHFHLLLVLPRADPNLYT